MISSGGIVRSANLAGSQIEGPSIAAWRSSTMLARSPALTVVPAGCVASTFSLAALSWVASHAVSGSGCV